MSYRVKWLIQLQFKSSLNCFEIILENANHAGKIDAKKRKDKLPPPQLLIL